MIYALFLSMWRRWFGGGLNFLPDNRFLQHVIGFLAAAFALWWSEYDVIQSILGALILQGLYWARSHGCCFDYGHGIVDVKRYDQLWYWKYVKKIIPLSEWYTFTGDYILMTVRYTIPAILMSIVLLEPTVATAGVVLSGVYALMWKLFDWDLIKSPTEKAEFIVGFTTGLFLVF